MKPFTIRSLNMPRALLLLFSVSMLASCSMPPSQAWNMIQREGLFNYWAYSSGNQPLYRAPMSSPPLQRSSLAYRPPYARYGDNFASSYRTSSLPYRAPSYSAPSLSQNRYISPPYTPRVVYDQPESKPKTHSSSRRSTKPKVASRPKTQESSHDEPLPSRTQSPSPSIASKPSTAEKKPSSSSPKVKEIPYGSPVPGRPNMVNSPYAGKNQLVDVGGLGTGQTVKCPYSGKLFKVPPSQQAANKVESKLDAPKLSSPSEDKGKSAPKSDEKPKSDEPKP